MADTREALAALEHFEWVIRQYMEGNTTRDAFHEARQKIVAAIATQPAQAVPLKDGAELWLWKNGDHFLAFTHLYPCFTPGGDPMVLGEPAGRAVYRVSHDRAAHGIAPKAAQQEKTDE